jgi:hypothetical protein
MTAEQYITLIVSLIAATAVILGPILLYLVKIRHENSLIRHENRTDHAKVVTSVEVLATQVAALTALVVESSAQLKAHTKWEETQKYATADTVAQLIEVIRDAQSG